MTDKQGIVRMFNAAMVNVEDAKNCAIVIELIKFVHKENGCSGVLCPICEVYRYAMTRRTKRVITEEFIRLHRIYGTA